MFAKIISYILSPLLKWLAEENVLVTTVKEGTVKAIMRGASFDHFIMAFEGYHINNPKKDWYKETFPEWEILYHGKDNPNGFTSTEDSKYEDRSNILRNLGLYWVGWPWSMNVYVYQFEWNETYTEHTTGDEKILPRAEPTDFIYVTDFIYAIKTIGAETKDRLATDELTLVTIAIRNPYRALFSGEDWMRRITAAINRHVRTFVGSKDYQELISPAGGKESEKAVQKSWTKFSLPIIALNDKLPDDVKEIKPAGLKGRYGVEIRTADLQTMDLSGDGKTKNQEATTKVYVATQEAKALVLAGEAKAKVVELMGDAEALALSKRLAIIKEHGEAGMTLAGYDAIQESSKNSGSQIIWANNPLGALAGILKPETKGREKS